MKNNKTRTEKISIINYLFSLPNMIAISLGIFLLAILKLVEKTIDQQIQFVEKLGIDTESFLDYVINIVNIKEILAAIILITLTVIFFLSQWANKQKKKLTWWSSIVVLVVFIWICYHTIPHTEFFVDNDITNRTTFITAIKDLF